MFIDTHAHLFLEEFFTDIEEVIDRSKQNQITKIVCPNVDDNTIDALKKLCEQNNDICIPLMGLHPESVKKDYNEKLDRILGELDTYEYYGVGEIGIDLYWDKTFAEEQMVVFEKQIQKALHKNLPVVIHTRLAYKEVFGIVDKYIKDGLKGIFHCFSGSYEDALHILEYKTFKIGIGGVVTYKKSELPNIVKNLPLESIVLETDSPYLAPVPRRGRRNESAFLIHVASKVAEIKQISVLEVAQVTSNNAKEIFNF